jgi:hypothetical protein
MVLLALAAACGQKVDVQPDGGDSIPCKTRLDCPGRLGCVEGLCGPCLRDRDCLAAEFCHPADSLCHSLGGDECRLNDECPLGAFCVQGWCKKAEEVVFCLKNQDCPESQRCDPVNLVCVPDFGCNVNAECAQGEICDLASRRCTPACTPETEKVICGAGRVCDSFGRCVECFEDRHCGVGLHCNLEIMRCQGENSCVTSRDCLPGQVCNPQTFQCTASPPPCVSNADCPSGRVCNTKTGQCESGDCRPDRFEPDDTPDEAATISAGSYDQLVLCPGDIDWYGVELNRADRLLVIVNTNFLAAGNFQTVLFDPEWQILQEGSLLLDATVSRSGRHFIRCQTLEPQAAYSLILNVSRGVPCDDDELEPNDGALQAVLLAPASYGPLTICPADEDWFVVERAASQNLKVSIEFSGQEGNLDLELRASDTRTVVDSSTGAGDFELVQAPAGLGTRFYVRVFAAPQVRNQYEMKIVLEE